jgi:putative ABC transport system permease protein
MHDATKDWGMVVPLELLRQRERTQNIFTIVMCSIAAISLVVGGIGIMNIMLASVYERRKEIGTRRALGAQKSDILLQFLIETVFLTTSGGITGILLGVGLGKIITNYSGMETIYSWWSIVLALAISCIVGVVFGTYPAWQAAQQNPITVLRSE